MKATRFITVLFLASSGAIYAVADGHNHGHEHKPLHGGIVTEVKDVDFEFVAKPESLQLYVRDHGKPVDIAKASAKLTVLAGTEKQEIELKPAGDRFEAKGTFKVAPGAKAVALVVLPGKPAMTARFVLR